MAENNQLLDYPKEYDNAKKWYGLLREKFIQQIQNHLESKQIQDEMEEFFEDLEKRVVAELQKNNNSENVIAIVSKIAEEYLENILQENSNIQVIINKKIKEIQTLSENTHDAERDARNEILGIIGSSFNAKRLEEILISTIRQSANISSDRETAIRYEALIQNSQNLLARALAKKLNKNSMSYFKTLITSGGYIKEDLELQALEQTLNKFGVEATPGGTRKVGGTETHMDIILSFDKKRNKILEIESMPEILRTDEMTQALDAFDRNFNKQITLTRNDPFKLNKEAQQELLKNIRYFGVQSKTFSLNANKRMTGSLQGLRISSQSEMYKEYMSKKSEKYNVYDVINNIGFVGMYKHILQSFGADTVIFSTKDGRYFLDDFIQEMKKQHYYLLFGLQDQVAFFNSQGQEVPKDLERRHKLTSTVVIDKPWYPRVKTNRDKTKTTTWTLYKPYQKK